MRGTSRGRLRGNPKIVGGLLAAAVTAAMASAVPATAEGTGTQTSDHAHRLSPRLALVASGRPASSPATSGTQLSIATTGPGSMLRTPDGRLVVDVRLASRDAATLSAIAEAGGRLMPQPADYGRLAVSVLPQDVAALAAVPG